MKYTEIQKDLFEMPANYTFMQCISADFVMAAGIAVLFNQYYDIKNRLINAYGNGEKMWNDPSHYELYTYNGFCIYEKPVLNLITKEYGNEMPTYKNLAAALLHAKSIILQNSITRIAMPKIGCGIDGLEWERVSDIIKSIYEDLDVEIVVCYI